MRLNGFFKGNAPFLLFSVKAEKPKIRRKVHFLIDTGADVTGIGLKDCLAMGLSLGSLGRPVRSISGLKDKARRWEVKKISKTPNICIT